MVSQRKTITTDASLSGWGATFDGEDGQRLVGRQSQDGPHQLLGVDGGLPRLAALRVLADGVSRPGQDRQYHHGELHQPARGSSVPNPTCVGTRGSALVP